MEPVAHHPLVDFAALRALGAAALAARAEAAGLSLPPGLERGELLYALLRHEVGAEGRGVVDGTIEVLPDGYGFVRSTLDSWSPQPSDPFVSPAQIRKLNLRTGQRVAGTVRCPRGDERFFALQHVDRVDGADPEPPSPRVPFASRTPILPTARLRLATDAGDALAAVAALAPWGRGHRVLVTAPAAVARRASLLAGMATALRRADPDLACLVCLVDQRPEDVAAARAHVEGTTIDVVATTFDEPPARHASVAEMALARAQREVETGRDVVLLFDSLTAFARACHVEQPPSGKLATVGLDALATARGKRLFAAARACEEGGSLTVIATVIAAPTRIDEAILADFERPANSVVAYASDPTSGFALPDLRAASTRAEDLLQTPAETARATALRAECARRPDAPPAELLTMVLARLANAPSA